MSKFTPGPWKVDSNGLVTGGPYTSICETYKLKWALSQAKAGKEDNSKVADWCGENYEIDNANGRLIAAAPDLYDTLQAVRAWLQGDYDHPALMAKDELPIGKESTIIEWINEVLATTEERDVQL